LSEYEHEQIYKIIRESTDQVTCAETGVFVSADVLDEGCFSKIETYVHFCFEQKKRLDADDAARAETQQFMNDHVKNG